MATVCFLVLAGCLVLGCGADVGDLFGEPGGDAGGKDGGGGAGGAISTGGTGGNTGGHGGSTPDGGGGTGGDAGGAGGMAGEGGAGGSGGTGGGVPTCEDPPEPNAVTFKCSTTNACHKIAVLDGGVIVPAESSNNDNLCEKLPFSTHPTSGQVVGVWVSDPNPANNDAFIADSLGSYPSICYAKCGPAPVPGPAPDHTQMETQLLAGGFSMVACGSNPAVTLGMSCSNGLYAVLQY